MDKPMGMKFDSEKVQLELLSPIWLVAVGEVLTFGARKYAAHNWRNGILQSKLIGAAMRHLLAYQGGEDYDPESGLCHLHHASCCLMFLSELRQTHPGLDDRYKVYGPRPGEKVSDKPRDAVSERAADDGPLPDPAEVDPRGR